MNLLFWMFALIAVAASGAMFIAWLACYGMYMDYRRGVFDHITCFSASFLLAIAYASWTLASWMFGQWLNLAHLQGAIR